MTCPAIRTRPPRCSLTALGEAKLAVHLLGKDSGRRIGVSRLVDLQLMETFKQPIPRIVWAPATLFDDPTGPEGNVREHDRNPLNVLRQFDQYRDGDNGIGGSIRGVPAGPYPAVRSLRPSRFRVQAAASRDKGTRAYVYGAAEDAALVDSATGMLINA